MTDQAPTTDELRAVIIGLMDKCHQIEGLLFTLPRMALTDESLANLRAYRSTLRGYLTRLRSIERGEPHPLPGNQGPTPTKNTDCRQVTEGPAHAKFQKSSYRDARQ